LPANDHAADASAHWTFDIALFDLSCTPNPHCPKLLLKENEFRPD
jgi:hypothetical protein